MHLTRDSQTATKTLLDQLVTYTPLREDIVRVRMGREGDGGYVVLSPLLQNLERFYSYGISDDFSFDSDLHGISGALGRLYDPNVSYSQSPGPGLSFRPMGLACGHGTIADHVRSHGDQGKRMLLKVDVEGAEWEWLAAASNEELAFFDQICIEFHFSQSREKHDFFADCLRRLNKHFYLFHVHSNNFCPLAIYPEGLLPLLLECSYVRKEICDCSINTSVKFPFPIVDWPCVESYMENELDFWPFISRQDRRIEEHAVSEATKKAKMRSRLVEARRKLASLESELQSVKTSASWRLTAPLRKVRTALGW